MIMIFGWILATVGTFIFIVSFLKRPKIVSNGTNNGSREDHWTRDWAMGFGVACAIFTVICLGSWGESYSSALSARTFSQGIHHQYRDAIEMYADRAVLTIDEKTFTDFRYEGYQENMAKFIRDFRRNIINYNDTLLRKREKMNSIVFNWLVIPVGEEYKLLQLIEE